MYNANMKEELYAMKIGGERIRTPDGIWDIWRVPGGWIYGNAGMNHAGGVFVPFFREYEV